MGERKKMKTRYRRFPLLSDIHGIKSSIGEMKGIGHPKQPPMNKKHIPQEDDPLLDEAWFENTIKEKLYHHPDNIMEYPHYGESIFKERCMKRVEASTKYCMKGYHIFIYGCGICATGTPCESCIPEPLI